MTTTFPEKLTLIHTEEPHLVGQRKQNTLMVGGAKAGHSLQETLSLSDEQVQVIYPQTDGDWRRFHDKMLALFDLDLPPEISREEFVQLYKIPLSLEDQQ